MQLRVLGCHGGETPKHRTTSFLLGDEVAIDAGAITSMLSLEEQTRIRSVLVSHPHMDHVRDLATLADNRCQQGGATLDIVGVPATIDALRKSCCKTSSTRIAPPIVGNPGKSMVIANANIALCGRASSQAATDGINFAS